MKTQVKSQSQTSLLMTRLLENQKQASLYSLAIEEAESVPPLSALLSYSGHFLLEVLFTASKVHGLLEQLAPTLAV
ncbi:hypothetical protein DHL47_02400 [Streptococcus panodentis]|uniref:Uncharacterized protein n=1 Tax=Streptococcus panodentis TaxID=1581472 RepID=A0ABS5AUF8_9STRE|nr:hypothetical protein STRDD11_01798 [Streptococcus sp. DD11]MBP2620202.1 hypothetical protein [Streptococcus panodentis]